MIKLTINQQEITTQADPEMPLLWFLREEVQLTGTKFGCGQGLCGACTVLLDGEPIRSCLLPLAQAKGKTIETIENDNIPELQALQAAWLEHSVPQCGYCQSGQLMSATHLLQSNKAPDNDAIHSAMSGNICRCGTYERIAKGINQAALDLAREI